MLKTKSFFTVDFGAGSLKLAEFETGEAGGLVLRHYSLKPLGQDGAVESKREPVVLKALEEAIAAAGARAKEVNICAPGFHVFSKFVKLPPVDSGKVTQIIQYEAQQNVPFPLAEVVWDYQILGSTPGGELEVLLVAIKSDVVEKLFRMTDSAGLTLQITDVSAAALCNAFRYNYGDLEGCTMLLDIGAKTSNLVFFEKGKVYSRGINLGANSITQDFASEAKLAFDTAEKIKIQEGFVSLGGAYEEPDNPHQAAISKIARQFMTRLHIQVNQTLQFYRGQQGGSAPDRLFLCGGASVMPYTPQFFAEKLGIPVEYFNPFRNVQIDPEVNLEDLARVAHSLGETVGLGLRNLAHCPVELNLMPESTLRWQSFNQKKPYFVSTVIALVLVVLAVGWLFGRSATVKRNELARVEQQTAPMKQKEVQFKRTYGNLQNTEEKLQKLTTWADARYHWADVFSELRRIMILVEEAGKRKLGADVGLWIEDFTTIDQGPTVPFGQTTPYGRPGGAAPTFAPPGEVERDIPRYPGEYGGEKRSADYSRYRMGAAGNRYNENQMNTGAGTGAGAEAGVQMEPVIDPATGQQMYDANGQPMMKPVNEADKAATITLVCRAVSLTAINPTANTDIAFALQSALKASPLFDPEKTSLEGQFSADDDSGTFTFGVNLVLKHPLEL